MAGLPGLRPTAVPDPDPVRAKALGERHGVPALGSLEELLEREDVEAVAIAVPPAAHAAMATAALRAGRHVFCEKPLATTARDARAVARDAERAGRALVVDHVLRYNPLLRAVERIVAQGLLAAPRRFLFENDASDQDLGPGHWFWDRAHSGGIFVEHGVHFFDAARALLGSDRVSVRATAGRARRHGQRRRPPPGRCPRLPPALLHPRAPLRRAVDAPGPRIRRDQDRGLDPGARGDLGLDRRAGGRGLGAAARTGRRAAARGRLPSARR
ncbi:Gfo/Idh/MocA family protein [Streptomyces sp. NPDC006978]|uniref:Gfo/Idh/MocA family protein n=1 Tax=Streptomyces sp. NPDC006978 TaxID=3364769 RepID=UPI0036C96308